jgi:hypothetical protein
MREDFFVLIGKSDPGVKFIDWMVTSGRSTLKREKSEIPGRREKSRTGGQGPIPKAYPWGLRRCGMSLKEEEGNRIFFQSQSMINSDFPIFFETGKQT